MVKLFDLAGIKDYWNELIDLYVACFAEPPWNEVIGISEAEDWFREMLGYPRSMALVFIEGDKPIGAAFSFPLLYKQDVAVYVSGDISPKDILYFSEIFVEKHFRNRGIATFIQGKVLEFGKSTGFTYAVARTNFNSKMFSILKREFEIIGEQDVISLKEVNGQKISISDKRGIFLKKI